MERWTETRGVRVPRLAYGTAWKEEATRGLVESALAAGFRGVDTANQRRHYFEAAVGEGLRGALASLGRDELFIQTKFTYAAGQDHRLPYDRDAPFARQVEQSFASSLEHLGVERVDSYVLHGPLYRNGLASGDHETWRAMEALHGAGKTRLLGVSNVSLEQLVALWGLATVKPAIVQNRCYAITSWDREVRAFCRDHDILYQGFSLLTANRQVLADPRVRQVAAQVGRSVPEVVFRFAFAVGMIGLTGTTSAEHMRQDLSAFDFELSAADVKLLEGIAK